VTGEPKSREDEFFASLTAREKEILLLAEGHSNQTIADCLGTVKAHNHETFSKLGLNSRAQAISRPRTPANMRSR
jgi:DNA-binding NarL/FixJ family response regulator